MAAGGDVLLQEGPGAVTRSEDRACTAGSCSEKKLLDFCNCFGSSSVVCAELRTDGGCDQLLGQRVLLEIAPPCLLQGKVAARVEVSSSLGYFAVVELDL